MLWSKDDLRLGSIFVRNASFFAHGGDQADNQFLAFVKFSMELITQFTFRNTNVILGGTILDTGVNARNLKICNKPVPSSL
jgi:hypothetical protein